MTVRVLALTVEQRRRLEAEAESAYPEECCGVLVGRDAGGRTIVEQVIAAENVSPRDRRRSFTINPVRVLEAHHRARALNSRVVGFYHSHPEGVARPSAHDAREAWPEMSYLILSREGRLTSWRRASGGELERETIAAAESGRPAEPLRRGLSAPRGAGGRG